MYFVSQFPTKDTIQIHLESKIFKNVRRLFKENRFIQNA